MASRSFLGAARSFQIRSCVDKVFVCFFCSVLVLILLLIFPSLFYATIIMDRLPYRQKFLNDRNSKICYHSLKDHPKVSKIAKFRCEML